MPCHEGHHAVVKAKGNTNQGSKSNGFSPPWLPSAVGAYSNTDSTSQGQAQRRCNRTLIRIAQATAKSTVSFRGHAGYAMLEFQIGVHT